jgi:sugar O-acyltransferase (sialic acid O-acetyltransferase NeuD family)
MPELVIYGSGGMGREVAEAVLVAAAQGPLRLVGFLDDSPELQDTEVLGFPVLGSAEWIIHHQDVQCVLGLGHPWSRYTVVQKIRELGGTWATVVHPGARVSPSAQVGEGSVVFDGCIVSSGAHLGRFNYLNYHTVVSHDARLDDFACIMSQAALSGNVRVGEGAFVGAGVTAGQGVSIGEWSLVGAGAVVADDIPPLCVAVGVPARPIRHYPSREDMPSF